MPDTARLDEFDKNEWRDVARRASTKMTDDEFEAAWNKFIEIKRRKQQQ